MTIQTPPQKAVVDKRGSGIQSVGVSLRVLRVLADSRVPMHLREIAAGAGLAPSQTHRYLRSFVEGGLVIQEPATGRYDLGGLALQLGLSALSRVDSVKLADEALESLIEQTAMAGGISVWGTFGQTCVRWHPSPHVVIATVALGTVFPMLNTAAGRLSMAYLPKSLTGPLVKKEIATAKKARRPIDMKAIEESIEVARRTGLCEVTGHSAPGLRSIAAPVFGADGGLSAIMALLGPEHVSQEDDYAAKLLARTAREVSSRLGHGNSPELRKPESIR